MSDGQPANPAPLGLAGFGLTPVALSCMNAGLFPAEAASVVVPLAFAYRGLAQVIAGIRDYRNGNTFGTVAFTSTEPSDGMPCCSGPSTRDGSSRRTPLESESLF